MINKGMMSSNTGEWATPQAFFDKLNAEFNFELDVCAAETNAKCVFHFTKEADGLSQIWKPYRCWMNPPYGREIGAWVKKASEANTLVVGLLPARTDTLWFWDYVKGRAEIRFIRGRLKFGGCKNSAPFPSMIAIWNEPKMCENHYGCSTVGKKELLDGMQRMKCPYKTDNNCMQIRRWDK